MPGPSVLPRRSLACGLAALLLATVNGCGGNPPLAGYTPEPAAVSPARSSVITAASAAPAPGPLHLDQRIEPSLPAPREETAAAELDGRLYVIGGFDPAGRDRAEVFVFGPGGWSAGPPLSTPVNHAAAAVLNGRLYVAGGWTSTGATGAVSMLGQDHSSWQPAPPLRHPRAALALVAAQGRLVAIGGRGPAGLEEGVVEAWTPGDREWTALTVLPEPRDHLAGFVLDGRACVAGGRIPATSARVDCFDLATTAWMQLAGLPRPTSGAGAAGLGGSVVVAGGELAGEGGSVLDQVAWGSGGAWTVGSMLLPRHGWQGAVMAGRLWACGGGLQPGLHPSDACTSTGLVHSAG